MGTASSHEYAKKQYMPELLGRDGREMEGLKGERGTGRGSEGWEGDRGKWLLK